MKTNSETCSESQQQLYSASGSVFFFFGGGGVVVLVVVAVVVVVSYLLKYCISLSGVSIVTVTVEVSQHQYSH